ncbi:B-cell receptor CD22 isoform X1 [Eptesicus fuscus]|uniref:B-cell receptor CD22 isoform X1 n=1 Tax=Eptesicus fuscus TaxID=29078 RepID=UPI002403CD85|nr:B-cell receptor CD22 isoform X1 [Eptesicus fuscus]
MHLLGPLFLLLEYLAFSNSFQWNLEHPATLYAWEGACVWIPCRYTIPGDRMVLENLTVYQNYTFDEKMKDYTGTILYEKTKSQMPVPQGRVKFLGDNKSNCTLHIHPVKAQDSGMLGLRMTSSKSVKWMEEIVLNVSEAAPPPRIEVPPEILEFQEVILTCLLNFACFEHQIKLMWLLEGSRQLPSDLSTSLTTQTVFTQSKLTLQPRWTHHGKNLTCQVWNDATDRPLSQETVWLDVKHRPKLEVSPKEAIVTVDDPVTMTCQVISSNPEFHTLSWLKDGTPIREQETLQREQKTLKLTLPKVTKRMSGKYHCEAHNDLGSSTSEMVLLQVRYAPEPSRVQIFSSPAKEGTRVKLTCISQANPPPTNYTWYHNNVKVWEGTDETFQIPQVLHMHAGDYSCLAENSLGLGKVDQKAELDVQYSPKEVTMVIQNPTPIREGDSVTLSCNYTSSNPSVTRYDWKPKGSWKELVPGVLTIQKVAWNAMPFTCAACNQWCSWAPPVNLQVQYAPRDVKVLMISPSFEIHSGHAVLLRCNFSSSRPTDVHFFWEKNGIFLKEGRELSFGSISPEDAGSYSCVASNSIGQSTSKAWELPVLYAPRRLRVSISPKDSVMEGKEAVLTCESDANPPTSHYTWFDWNNQDLHHNHRTLRLDPVKVQHSGAYWCQGSNRLGVDRSPPSTLTVYYSPQTISRRVALGLGLCLVILFLAFLGVKFQRSWKRIQSQQGPQENSSGQSFFVRNNKVRRAPLPEGLQSLGCYNPVMEDSISYATLRFPAGETDTPRIGDGGTPEVHRPSLNRDNTVTYSVVQKRPAGDYENVIPDAPDAPEDDGIHYSELVHLGVGERPLRQEGVEYVTLKH